MCFCVIGTIIDLVIEEQAKLAADRLPAHNNGGIPGQTSTSVDYNQQFSGASIPVNSDDQPLIDPPNHVIFSSVGMSNVIHAILSKPVVHTLSKQNGSCINNDVQMCNYHNASPTCYTAAGQLKISLLHIFRSRMSRELSIANCRL